MPITTAKPLSIVFPPSRGALQLIQVFPLAFLVFMVPLPPGDADSLSALALEWIETEGAAPC